MGQVKIQSPSIKDPAIIDPRYLDTQADQDAVVEGLDLAFTLGNSNALSYVRSVLLDPTKLLSRKDKLDYAKRTCMTYHHYVGTCRIGNDHLAVVDSDLNVRGIENLRIADASIIPVIPSTNTHVATLIVAEKASQLITG